MTVTATRVIFAGSNRGAVERERLTRALRSLACRCLRAHCWDPRTQHWWLSELEDERAKAARRCWGGPVLVECGRAATARRERVGVWGQKDYTRKPRKGAGSG